MIDYFFVSHYYLLMHYMFKTYKIYTLGCKVNQYDSSKVARDLQALGLVEVTQNADLAIINTCTVTHSALTKDRKMLEEARRENPLAKYAIVGCMPVNYREETERLGVDYIYGAKDLDLFIEKIKAENGSVEVLNCDLKLPDFKTDKSRYFLKIQDGCQQFCSYCIIAYNRGKLSSRNKEEIIVEVKQVVEQGVAEIVLCGIHLGLYGYDVESRKSKVESNLVTLIRELVEIPKLEKIRLSSIEITEVNDELIELIKTNRKMVRHLHIPMQAGCDKILKSMNRPYDKRYFAERLAKLRAVAPEIAITTDVMVGFPGEKEADFQETLRFCQEVKFSKIHVFPFSAHEKTPAYNFPDQQTEAVKKSRAKELQKISDQLEKTYNESFLGQEIEAIVDGRSKPSEGEAFLQGQGIYRAKSEYYFDIKFQSVEKLRVGQLVRVKDWELLKG